MDKNKCLYEIMQCNRCNDYVKIRIKKHNSLSNIYWNNDFKYCDKQYDALKACIDAEKAKPMCQPKSK